MRPYLSPCFLALSLVFAAPAHAESAAAAPPPSLAIAIEHLAAAVASETKREAPRLEPRLSRAAADLVRLTPEEGLPPGSAILGDALSLQGLVEPAPHLILATFAQGQDKELLAGLRAPLAQALTEGRWRRLGVAVAQLSESRSRVLVLLQESFLDLQPLPRSAPLSPAPLLLRGELLPPFSRPEVLVTNPAGQVERLPGTPQKGARFEASFRCLLRGRYQIEVLGEDSHGSTVLANFPLHCGQPAPRELLTAKDTAEVPFRDAHDAETQLFALLNLDRARFGLPALAIDARLADVARAHSLDMRTSNVLGHVSARTGNAGDRARRAGIDSVVLLENLARAYSPREAQRGLMESPGHRANVLDRTVTRVGLGVELVPVPGGGRELWVTQLFLRPPAPFDAAKAPGEALLRIQELRKQAGLGALVSDGALDKLAWEAATGVAAGTLSSEHIGAPVQEALGRLGGRYRLLRTVLALTGEIGRMASSPAFLDEKLTHVGVGVTQAPRKEGRAAGVYVVVVLGQGVPARAK